ncbi:MAG: glycoside hydrolase family 15 protein [Actinobacteria bacterium]|nr:glycoside hydrolase family 15 protein [Actinomycetota bacterium]
MPLRRVTPGSDPWRQPPIADYAFLSDCHSAALVDRRGSVDWWCVPRFDSSSVFGRLLDPDAGHWSIRPVQEFDVDRSYLGDSLVLRTVFRTATGEVTLTDAAALHPGARGHELGLRSPHTLVRRVEGVRGTVAMEVDFAPRMEYGRTQPHFRHAAAGVVARGGPVQVTLMGAIPFRHENGSLQARFDVEPGDSVELRAVFRANFGGPDDEPLPVTTLEDTQASWQSWSDQHTGYEGRYATEVRRSSIVLQGLTYQPSGAVVAAATTSLPERLGGDLNFDYRYAWLRDLSLTTRSLWIAACPDEPARLFDWFANATGVVGDEAFQIMYGVGGERDIDEHTLEHLGGYQDSRPVRIGNAAWTQVQLDVLGEILDAVHLMRDNLGELDDHLRDLLVAVADRAAAGWAEPDAGMWESREHPRHYVSSKVMCWVALDRAVALADRFGGAADPSRWALARAEVRAAVLERAWSQRSAAYAGAFDSDELDASVLLLPLVGFLPADDPRMRATIEAIERELGADGLVRRWRDDDNGFLICTFWLAECLAMAGEIDRAETWFASAAACANDLGLLSEVAVPHDGPLLGNFPQAFSHVGLINAAWRISEASPPTIAHAFGPANAG